MFKTLESKWNAHTPVYLHNRTKENLIFQLILAVVLFGGMCGWEEYKLRRDEKRRKNLATFKP